MPIEYHHWGMPMPLEVIRSRISSLILEIGEIDQKEKEEDRKPRAQPEEQR